LDAWREGTDLTHALLQGAAVDSDLEADVLARSTRLVRSLSGYFSTLPEHARQQVGDYLLLLEVMSERVFALASKRLLPVSDERLVDFLTDLWFAQIVEARQGLLAGGE
jgi:hypothetical protein